MEYTAIVKKTSNGWYIAQCEQVPGALTQGKTLEEVKENMKEAIFLVLESEKELGFRKETLTLSLQSAPANKHCI